MKKVITEIMFIISCILDTYTLTLLIHDITLNDVLLLLVIISNLALLIFFVFLILEMRKVRLLGNVCVDNIDLTVISQKNITRKKISTLQINTIEYTYVFSNNGFDAYIRYKGVVRKKFGCVRGILLNFSGDSNQTNESIDAYAYDLISDRSKKYKIMGKFAERSGLNKEVYFKFRYPMKKNERFDYLFHYRWNDCLNPQKDYVAAIPAFKYINPNELCLKVVFKDKVVHCFETYSINNYKVKEEERIIPYKEGKSQVFRYKYTLQEDFNFAVAVFYFKQ